MDTLTFLHASRVFAKARRPDGTVEPAARTPRDWHSWVEIPVISADQLEDVLREAAGDPTRLLISEAVKPGASPPIRRSSKAGDLLPRPRRWLCVDVDGLALPEGLDGWEDPRGAAEHARSVLPEGLRRARALVQLTASHRADAISAHLWFWLDRPVPARSVKRWLEGVPGVDLSVYDPVHPIYTANPVGTGEPRERFVRLDGEQASLSDPNVAQAAARAEKALAGACAAITANEGARHPVVNAQAYRMGRLVAAGRLDLEPTRIALITAATKGGNPLSVDRARDEVGRALDDGMAEGPALDVQRTKDEKIKPTDVNALLLLAESEWGSAVWYDTFRDAELVGAPLERVPTPLSDQHIHMAACFLQREADALFPIGRAADALHRLARDNARDPVADEIRSAEWDGERRLDTWLTRYAGAEDSAYVRGVARYTILAIVSRQLRPGTKADMMPILVGPQGAGKSSLWRVIAGDEWRAPVGGDDSAYRQLALRETKQGETIRQLQGALIAEDDELRSLAHAAALEHVKSFLTATSDVYRAPYARMQTVRPRRFLAVGSTNHARFLNDPTGNRRFLPVQVCDDIVPMLDALAADRMQLLAEARAVLESGEAGQWWRIPDAAIAQAAAGTRDPARAEALRLLSRQRLTAYDLCGMVELKLGTRAASDFLQWLETMHDLRSGEDEHGDPLYGTKAK